MSLSFKKVPAAKQLRDSLNHRDVSNYLEIRKAVERFAFYGVFHEGLVEAPGQIHEMDRRLFDFLGSSNLKSLRDGQDVGCAHMELALLLRCPSVTSLSETGLDAIRQYSLIGNNSPVNTEIGIAKFPQRLVGNVGDYESWRLSKVEFMRQKAKDYKVTPDGSIKSSNNLSFKLAAIQEELKWTEPTPTALLDIGSEDPETFRENRKSEVEAFARKQLARLKSFIRDRSEMSIFNLMCWDVSVAFAMGFTPEHFGTTLDEVRTQQRLGYQKLGATSLRKLQEYWKQFPGFFEHVDDFDLDLKELKTLAENYLVSVTVDPNQVDLCQSDEDLLLLMLA